MIRKNQQILMSLQRAIDLLIMFISIISAFYIRFYNYDGSYITLKFYLIGGIVLSPLYLYICRVYGLYKQYRTKGFFIELIRIVEATLTLTGLIFVILFMVKEVNISRMVILLFIIINIGLSSAFRFTLRKFLRAIRKRGYNLKYILLIGDSSLMKRLDNMLNERIEFGYKVIKYKGKIDDLADFLNRNFIDEIFVFQDEGKVSNIKLVYNVSERYGVKLNIVPSYTGYLPSRLYIDQLEDIPVINIRNIPLENILSSGVKRFVDVFLSIIAIILLLPVYIIVAILIKFDSEGPIFYKQERMGFNRRKFYIYKFRSMSVAKTSDENICGDESKRCTKFGRFIRRYNIDELPQFFNVLKGDMSLVGPRPEIPELVDKYKEKIPSYMMKHQVRCGMTGLAQIKGFTGKTSIRKRIRYDMRYVEQWNIFLDFKILLLTIPSIIKKKTK